jgi:hypothetical protein
VYSGPSPRKEVRHYVDGGQFIAWCSDESVTSFPLIPFVSRPTRGPAKLHFMMNDR